MAHEGAINAHIVRETMPLYDPVYRQWLISEKYKDEHAGQTKLITVEIPRWLSCPDGSHKDKFDEILAKERLKEQEVKE